MQPGETILTGFPDTCEDCGDKPAFQVLHSGGGWYIGTKCQCGPYSRESMYFPTKESAEQMFKLPPHVWQRK